MYKSYWFDDETKMEGFLMELERKGMKRDKDYDVIDIRDFDGHLTGSYVVRLLNN